MLPSSRPSRRTTALRCASATLFAALLAATAVSCSSGDDAGGEDAGAPDTTAPESSGPARAVLAAPTEPAAVVPAASAGERALAGAALFETAPAVVLAPEGDLAAQAPAASAAVALGVPLLLTPAPSSSSSSSDDTSSDTTSPGDTTGTTAGEDEAGGVEEEVERLEPTALLAYGDAAAWAEDVAGDDGPEVVEAPADDAPAEGVPVGEPEDVAEDDLLATVAALSPDAPPSLRLADDSTDDTGADEAADGESSEDANADTTEAEADEGAGGDREREGVLGAVEPAEEGLGAVAVLVGGEPEDVAVAATARAAGALVVAAPDGDPRAEPDAIAALAAGDAAPEQVVAVGGAFAGVEAEVLRARVDVASTGVELPGGGQVLYPGRRMAALYGHPGTPAMGVLGEQGVAESVARAERLAAEYDGLVDEPVIPAFEVIATVASSAAGPDGDYSAESEVADLRPWVDAAAEAGVYVVLDLQPGRTDFLTQAQRYEELLLEPHVGLALDPEWRIGPDQRHLEQIGSVSIDEVNRVGDWLAQLTAENQLPQKLLLLHQFRLAMIDGRERLDMGHDELAVLIHADGFGTAGQKFATWDALHQGEPEGVWWGWKNFYDEDQPMFTPQQTTAISPPPVFVSYQ